MLHPKLQAQINECLDKKTDTDHIAMLFRKISEAYYAYEKQLGNLSEIQVSELSSHAV